MNTQATQHPPTAIELLSDVLTHAHDDSVQEVAEAIASIWLSVFRTKQSFTMALDALRLSHDSINARDKCDYYLNVMRGMK